MKRKNETNNMQKNSTGRMRKLAIIALTGALAAGSAMPAFAAAKTPVLTRKLVRQADGNKKTYAKHSDERYSYRSDGQIKSISDGIWNTKTTYKYDKNGRIKESVSKGEGSANKIFYKWNKDGTQVTITEPGSEGKKECVFFKNGNIKEVKHTDRDGTLSEIDTYTYNKKGDLLTRTDTSYDEDTGKADSVQKDVYKYNKKGKLLSYVSYYDGKQSEKYVYTYKKGKLKKEEHYNEKKKKDRTITYTYKGNRITAREKNKALKSTETIVYDTRYIANPETPLLEREQKVLPYAVIKEDLKEGKDYRSTITHKIKAYQKGALKGVVKGDDWVVTHMVNGKKSVGAKGKERYTYKISKISKKQLRIQETLRNMI